VSGGRAALERCELVRRDHHRCGARRRATGTWWPQSVQLEHCRGVAESLKPRRGCASRRAAPRARRGGRSDRSSRDSHAPALQRSGARGQHAPPARQSCAARVRGRDVVFFPLREPTVPPSRDNTVTGSQERTRACVALTWRTRGRRSENGPVARDRRRMRRPGTGARRKRAVTVRWRLDGCRPSAVQTPPTASLPTLRTWPRRSL